MKGSPDLRVIMESPSVSVARKRTVIRRIAEALGLDRIIRNFLVSSMHHRRTAPLPEMIEGFEVLLDERLGFVRADKLRQPPSPPSRKKRSCRHGLKLWQAVRCACASRSIRT